MLGGQGGEWGAGLRPKALWGPASASRAPQPVLTTCANDKILTWLMPEFGDQQVQVRGGGPSEEPWGGRGEVCTPSQPSEGSDSMS